MKQRKKDNMVSEGARPDGVGLFSFLFHLCRKKGWHNRAKNIRPHPGHASKMVPRLRFLSTMCVCVRVCVYISRLRMLSCSVWILVGHQTQ